MANLKDDLDQYMLMNEERKSPGFKMPFKVPSMPSFGGSSSTTSTPVTTPSSNSWLNDNDDDGWCPKMTRFQKILASIVCFAMGTFCMVVALFYIPMLVFKARKFALLYSLGSVLFIAGISFMFGFKSTLQKLFAKEKLAVSIIYVGSLFVTLYFAMIAQSTAMTVLFAVIQIMALAFILFGIAPPGSATGMKLFGSVFKSKMSSTLPI